jgi:hypothetical protein
MTFELFPSTITVLFLLHVIHVSGAAGYLEMCWRDKGETKVLI